MNAIFIVILFQTNHSANGQSLKQWTKNEVYHKIG